MRTRMRDLADEIVLRALPLLVTLGVASSCAAHQTKPGTTDAAGPSDGSGDAAACRDVAPAGAEDCDAPLGPGSSRTCSVSYQGTTRTYLLYAPANYRPCDAAPLIIDAHGTSETAAEQAGLDPFLDWPDGLGSGWRLVADREGFIVAQPQGINNKWSASDADLMLEIVSRVKLVASVDPARVYMTGISNGGQLTYWTGCKDTTVFRGFAPVSGYGQQTCPITHPAPLIHFHSPDDKVISNAAGRSAFQMWVASNHCQHGPSTTLTFGGPSTDPRPLCLHGGAGSPPPWSLVACDPAAPVTTCETWDQCDGGIEATYCTVAADDVHHFDTTGGHILYINGTDLSLAAVAWEYFKKF